MKSNFEFLESQFPVLANFGWRKNIYTAIPIPA